MRRFLVPLCAVWALAAPAAEIHLEALDAEGRPVWARFEVRGADGRMYQPPFSLRDRSTRVREGGDAWYVGSFVAKGRTTIEAPAGDYTVVIDRGPEFERWEGVVSIGDDSPGQATVAPQRWIHMNDLGWYSADFHIHRPLEDIASLVEAEGLNLAVVQTVWNNRDLWKNRPWPTRGVKELGANRVMTVRNAEDERGGGAWMLHNLNKRPSLAADGRWYPLGLRFIEQAKAQRYVAAGFPWIDVEKAFWWEVPVVMALSPPDSIGLLHNHFYSYGMLDNEAWGRPRNEKAYPGAEGFAQHSMELVYRYWNLGMQVKASAGSASGVLPNPVGYNRIYVQLDEPFGVEPFYRGLRQAKSFVTNGPMLFFDAWEAPGGELRMTVEVESREPLEKVEIIANGVIIETFSAPPGQTKLQTEVTIRSGLYTWVAARAFVQNDDTIRLAHSQPVFFPGAWNASADAAYFVEWMDDLIRVTEEDEERFADPRQRDEVMKTYGEARAFYERLR